MQVAKTLLARADALPSSGHGDSGDMRWRTTTTWVFTETDDRPGALLILEQTGAIGMPEPLAASFAPAQDAAES
jgi:hypothetical protein